MTRVRIPPTLRPEVGGERQVEASGGTVRELLDDLIGRFPGLRAQLVEEDEIAPFVNVYVEGEDVRTLDGLETPVREGATVILLPAMAGGAPRGNLPVPPGPPPLVRFADRAGGAPRGNLPVPPGPPPLVRFADRRLTPPAGGS